MQLGLKVLKVVEGLDQKGKLYWKNYVIFYFSSKTKITYIYSTSKRQAANFF